ncbi:uncharacterized protein SSYIS1_00190 [Serratia symbiotica]|uniref:Uncharacterized protein n=1 Tax=Serratia symbiotica TaxID=138074 RepID=A0A455VDF3_9GAMM|nr:uncharacterized protein SSYIS1_00190 [Serratia symbiotica]
MQDIITATQFADFALQLLQTLAFSGAQSAITAIGIPFMLAPGTKSLRRAAYLGGDGAESGPLRTIFVLAFQNQTNGPLTDFGEKRVFLVILFTSLSESLVSRITGAVQSILTYLSPRKSGRFKPLMWHEVFAAPRAR